MMNQEHHAQAAVMLWAKVNERQFPELKWLHAIPNGGHRNIKVAQKLKAEGVKAGVPDLCLPVPRQGFSGLYIEMKIAPNKPTPNQIEWLEGLRQNGFKAIVCYGSNQAIAALQHYLER